MTSYLTSVVTASANIIAQTIHMASNHISTAPNYKYIMGLVNKRCRNYRTVLLRLGCGRYGILRAIIPTGVYALYALQPLLCILQF